MGLNKTITLKTITIEYLQSNEYTCVINETCITQNLINIIS